MSRQKTYYENIAVVGEEEWLWSANFNALYKRDRSAGKIEKVGDFTSSCKTAAYSKIVVYKKKIIGLPFAADQIFVYDIEESRFRYVDIGIQGIETKSGHLNKFYGAVTRENLLYMIGCNTAYILVFDMEKESVEDYIDLYPYAEDKEVADKGYMREGILYKNTLLAPAAYENFIFEIDLNDLHVTKRRIEKHGKGFSAIHELDGQIWLLPYDEGDIIVWDIAAEKKTVHCVDRFFSFVQGKRNFLSAAARNKRVWIFPIVGSAVLSYDCETGTFSNQNDINVFFESLKKTPKFVAADLNGNEITLLTAEIHENVIFDMEKGKMRLAECDISAVDLLEILDQKDEKLVSETEFSLSDYLDFISLRKGTQTVSGKKCCGKDILNVLLKQL